MNMESECRERESECQVGIRVSRMNNQEARKVKSESRGGVQWCVTSINIKRKH